jgi:hypothetical protein
MALPMIVNGEGVILVSHKCLPSLMRGCPLSLQVPADLRNAGL